MLIILLSRNASFSTILPLLAIKFMVGIISGFTIDFLLRNKKKKQETYSICEDEHCGCEHEENLFKSSLIHTIKTFIFIFIATFIITLVFELFGEEYLSKLLLKESSKTWVDEKSYNNIMFFDNYFVMPSMRDGNRHLYQYSVNGKLMRKLTSGKWDVISFLGSDGKKNFYYTGNPAPMQVSFCKLFHTYVAKVFFWRCGSLQGSRVLLKGAAIMTAFSLLGKLLGVLLRLFLSSRIGSEGLGLYQLIMSVYGLFATFSTCPFFFGEKMTAEASERLMMFSSSLSGSSLSRGTAIPLPHRHAV